MIGISWGGFNGLQVAARRPPSLKAVISLCSTDDRYADDVHYMGGSLLVDNFSWASMMFSLQTYPPDPLLVGERWRKMWLERLEKLPLLIDNWLKHQRRDAYWKHGSVCENYADITAAVYAVGGWADGYSNAVPRLLAGLKCPKKGLIGPWAHRYPHFADPGPRIGFLSECLRWWDQWLKGSDTGIMDEPAYRVWMQDWTPPQSGYTERPGRWVAEPSWPSPNVKPKHLALNEGGLADKAESGAKLTVPNHLTVGLLAGHWCPYGIAPDQPSDQSGEDGQSLVFDTRATGRGDRNPRRAGCGTGGQRRPPAGAALRAPQRCGAGRLIAARHLWHAEPDPSCEPREAAGAQARPALSHPHPDERHRPDLSQGPSHPAGDLGLVLAHRLAFARSGKRELCRG